MELLSKLVATHLSNLKDRPYSRDIPICPLNSFNLDSMIAKARSVRELCAEEPGKWSRVGNYYQNGNKVKVPWCRLKSDEKVIFSDEKVLAYISSVGNVLVRICGVSNRVKKKLV